VKNLIKKLIRIIKVIKISEKLVSRFSKKNIAKKVAMDIDKYRSIPSIRGIKENLLKFKNFFFLFAITLVKGF
jgi:hypothetical protein